MKLTTFYLPEGYVKALDELVEVRSYSTRSEAIRKAIGILIEIEKDYLPPGQKSHPLNIKLVPLNKRLYSIREL